MRQRNNRGGNFFIYLIVLALIFYAIGSLGDSGERMPEIDTSEFLILLEENKVEELSQQGNYFTINTTDDQSYQIYMSDMVAEDIYSSYLVDRIEDGQILFSQSPVPDTTWQREIASTLLMIGFFALMWFFIMRSMQGGNNNAMSFGKSRAKLHEKGESSQVSFDDVAGLYEEKEELSEIVDFLKNPRKYDEVGARIPKGVLMVGPPGTGKTYLSRAVAGEAGVPFFTISGSDFVEMFVGVGASRVRDLFENAKKNAPAIIFIDEIDAVGRRRGAGMGGGHDEREQTLNQLLVEMDGFKKNEGIIIMAATNRADILDPALLRPGRFDRTVQVGYPDVRAREEILEVHSKSKPLADDVDLRTVARRTPGFSPADLENMLNEAALLTARDGKKQIDMKTINEAEIKVQAGPEKKSAVVSKRDRKITAYHEAGHAIVSRLMPNQDPVHMITIVPRGRAGGFTSYVPEEEEQYMTKSSLEQMLVTLLGGRAAEKIVFDDISTGASNDIERATDIARMMVTKFGMSEELGTVKYGDDDEQVFVGANIGTSRNYSELVASKIDQEISRLIDQAYNKALELIRTNKETLIRVSDALLEYETISGQEFEKIFQGETLDDIKDEVDHRHETNEENTQEIIKEEASGEKISDQEEIIDE